MDHQPKPAWLKTLPPGGATYGRIKSKLSALNLHTVCQEASCPNLSECWASGTATFLILGDICTRGCRFCDVRTGRAGAIVDIEEPKKVAEAVAEWKLKYVVITSVDRDDLPDGGASQFVETVKKIKALDSNIKVELLVPDFQGNREALDIVALSGADVIGHNVETVRRLTSQVRDRRCNFEVSLEVLKYLKEKNAAILTKSSLMLGMSETRGEILETMRDLLAVNVDIITLGQYLRPSMKNLPVVEYIAPECFKELEQRGYEMGFKRVFSGPLVRSSYRAGEKFIEALCASQKS